MTTESVETLIIGAGVSGLAAAAFVGPGAEVLVLEGDSEIGGYCKTVTRDGFVWDYSGHFFHFQKPWVEAWLKERMGGQEILTVKKRSFISTPSGWIDFPFQKNIHQLALEDFIACLHDFYFAEKSPSKETSFKAMLLSRFGSAICERFLFPYNEKLYSVDLNRLDPDAMGRFFPQADFAGLLRHLRSPSDDSYNATFTYPRGGAIEYVKAIASRLPPGAIALNESAERIDLARREVTTSRGRTLRFSRLISSAPFPRLLAAAGLPVGDAWSWNQVAVFNLGFDRKGREGVHWLYVPNRERCFYRVGFYDNIFNTPRMSLYVEIGLPGNATPDMAALEASVLRDLKLEGIVRDERLVAKHSVVMNPAYVHITTRSNAEVIRLKEELARAGVYSIGRYGSWTYCSIEDNILEAQALVQSFSAAKENA